jgi:hypothetical protein
MTNIDKRHAGVVRTITDKLVTLENPQPEQLDMEDISWALGRILRYNGHIKQDFTVAHHSVVMSYMVPDEYRMEALLHDAAEAYMGDIIQPVKALFPEVQKLEAVVAGAIMAKYARGVKLDVSEHGLPIYNKSPIIMKADTVIYKHECFHFGRPGTYISEVEAAWDKAFEEMQVYWHAPWVLVLSRYNELRALEDDTSSVVLKRTPKIHNGSIVVREHTSE